MKNPNITDGKWELKEITNLNDPNAYDHSHFICSDVNDDIVCDIISDEFNIHSIENAKAISAVPEMIDALIHVYMCLHFCKDSGAVPNDGIIEEVKQALKKAGVEL